ncbi:hypothetical protein OROMI_000982 [Orobanche minor]
MASSQTSFFSEKSKESIIDGRLFVQVVVMNRIEAKNGDLAAMGHVVSRIKQIGLYNLERQHCEVFDESLVEEFYQDASVYFHSVKRGGDVAEITAEICGVEICINRHLLKDIFALPSSGLKMEELYSFGSEYLLTTFWGTFIGDSSDKRVHPSCHKKCFILPFIYLHDFCCRVVENRTGAFEMCTNLRFRMMVAIMFGEPVNWCQIVLKRLQEEVSKPASHKKSFGLILNNLLSCLNIHISNSAKKIGPGKFIGGCKPTTFNKDTIPANKPSIFILPQSENPRDVTEKKSTAVGSKKIKHSVSDKKSSLAAHIKKKHKKAHKPKPTEVSITPVEAPTSEIDEVSHPSTQPTEQRLQGATPVKDTAAAPSANSEPMAATKNEQLFAKEGTGESTAFEESKVASHVEQEFERFVQWKSYRFWP